MSANGFKLDINISQKEIANMAKQVIREIVESQIESVMKELNVEAVIVSKLNSSTIESKLSKTIEKESKRYIDDLKWGMKHEINKEIRAIVLKEVEGKPLSGNVYLKINNSDIETDYDY